ncbi:DNA polymerase III subunit delta' [uncultured Clostridium sp.]|uniref:DNA polymerase III subunit delta' n=1 Tax=uncultured Clostridium sp. TaxID=59620 RepID=UPI0028E756D9|nr:DNA polymerase III subunit delta' [uncultured Clostridium sp.]
MDYIIGHDHIKNQIINSINSERFSHAYLICGEDGIGKSLIAKGIACLLLGKEPNREYADIIECKISKNKKSIGVEEIRNIIEETNTKPYEGDKKVIIIYNSELMTIQAQNAFLKTLEEPPRGVFIIMLCEEAENVLDTIKSRCQVYKLNHLSNDEMKQFLTSKYPHLNEEELKIISVISDYIPGRGEKYIENSNLKEIRDNVLSILNSLANKDLDILSYEEILVKYKSTWKETLTWFLSYARDIMIYKEIGESSLMINLDKLDHIKNLAEVFSFTQLNDIMEIIKDTRDKLESNVNTSLVFDTMLLKMQEV